jgi:hypothetical protein
LKRLLLVAALLFAGCSGPVTVINPPPAVVAPAPIPPAPPVIAPPPPPPIPMPLPCHCATLTWEAPTTNTDGSPLSDLAGFYVHYWSATNHTHDYVLNIANAMATSQVLVLAPDTWSFAMTAYNTKGRESAFSATVTKEVQ